MADGDKESLRGTSRPSVPKVRLRSFSRSLPILLLQARESVMERFRSTLRHFQITEQQWRVLRALAMVPSIEVNELAKATCLLAPSVSRILRDMELRGLLKREQVAEDLRRSRVSITEAGLEFIDMVSPYSEAIYREITETYGEEKLRLLQGMLVELSASMATLPAVADLDWPPVAVTAAPSADPDA